MCQPKCTIWIKLWTESYWHWAAWNGTWSKCRTWGRACPKAGWPAWPKHGTSSPLSTLNKTGYTIFHHSSLIIVRGGTAELGEPQLRFKLLLVNVWLICQYGLHVYVVNNYNKHLQEGGNAAEWYKAEHSTRRSSCKDTNRQTKIQNNRGLLDVVVVAVVKVAAVSAIAVAFRALFQWQ